MMIMHVIYHCFGSAHSSIVAAAIHLGKLPKHRHVLPEDILSLPDFDLVRNDSIGHLYFKGHDEYGNKVYTLGMGAETQIVKRAIQSMINMGTKKQHSFYFAEALPHINTVAKFGGALSRRYGIVKLGRFLAAQGICQSYNNLLTFVERIKNEVKR